MMMLIVYRLIVFGLFVKYIHAADKIDYYNLHNNIFMQYNSDVRPVNDDTEVMKILIDFTLISVSELQEKEQTLVSFGYIYLTWDDDFLSWNETAYHGLINMVVPQNKVWRPDVVVGNSVEQRSKLGFDEMPIRLNYDGYVQWEPSNLFKTSCDINIKYYPFDTQVCTIIIETMVSTINELNLVPQFNEVLLADYIPNGQWELVSSALEKNDETYKSAVEIKLTLKRRRTFYVMNVILPVLFLSLMSSLTFALPADTGEKMSLSVTILLAYIVFLTIISDSMPQTSLQISILGLYLAILVALSTMSVVLSIPILRFYHKDSSIPVPRCGIQFVRRIGKCCRNTISHTTTTNLTDPEKTESPIEQNDANDGKYLNTVTWQHVSKSMDSLFCCLFVTITIISTIVFILLIAM